MTDWWALTGHTIVLEAAIFLACLLGHTLINPVPSIDSPFFISPRRSDSQIQSQLPQQQVVTTLVKEPEAELFLVIKASYLHNTSQAEGTQSFLPGPRRRSCPVPTLLSSASLGTWGRARK